jgi:hypothetical protein
MTTLFGVLLSMMNVAPLAHSSQFQGATSPAGEPWEQLFSIAHLGAGARTGGSVEIHLVKSGDERKRYALAVTYSFF